MRVLACAAWNQKKISGSFGWRGKCRPLGRNRQVKAMGLCCCRVLFIGIVSWPGMTINWISFPPIDEHSSNQAIQELRTHLDPMSPNRTTLFSSQNRLELKSNKLRSFLKALPCSYTNSAVLNYQPLPCLVLSLSTCPSRRASLKTWERTNPSPSLQRGCFGQNALSDYLLTLGPAFEPYNFSSPKSPKNSLNPLMTR